MVGYLHPKYQVSIPSRSFYSLFPVLVLIHNYLTFFCLLSQTSWSTSLIIPIYGPNPFTTHLLWSGQNERESVANSGTYSRWFVPVYLQDVVQAVYPLPPATAWTLVNMLYNWRDPSRESVIRMMTREAGETRGRRDATSGRRVGPEVKHMVGWSARLIHSFATNRAR